MFLSLLLMACLIADEPLPGPQDGPIAPEEPPPPPPPPRNIPPTIDSLELVPATITTNTDISVLVEASDPDDVPPQLSYQWSVNDRILYEVAGTNLPHRLFNKDDEIKVRVTARDGKDEAQQEISVTVGNASPSFVTDPRTLDQLDGFILEVSDPDDDDVTFRMEGAPMGMTIGERNGKIQYVGSVDEPGGDYQIQIIAEDGSGGSATWEFGISVSPGSNAP